MQLMNNHSDYNLFIVSIFDMPPLPVLLVVSSYLATKYR